MRRPHWPSSDKADRPFVAFVAVDQRHAMWLYRAQNVVWVWLGVVAFLACLSYFDRPHLGPVIVSRYEMLDTTRALSFGLGGILISAGIWTVRRVLEVWGHLFFATGAVLTALAELTLHLDPLSILLAIGVAVASAFRVWFIVTWIGTRRVGIGDGTALRRQ